MSRRSPSDEAASPGIPHELELSTALRREIDLHATAGHPHEVCGLLIGVLEGSRTRVERLAPAKNLNQERSRDRYELDPTDFLRADAAARADGFKVVGIWHTHPDAPATPSATDLEAAWEGYSYLIVTATREGAREFRSWRLRNGAFEVEPLVDP